MDFIHSVFETIYECCLYDRKFMETLASFWTRNFKHLLGFWNDISRVKFVIICTYLKLYSMGNEQATACNQVCQDASSELTREKLRNIEQKKMNNRQEVPSQ